MQQPELGKKISELRLAKGLTQSELAEKCNLSLRTIQRIELAEVDPRSDTIKRIFNSMDYDFYNSNGVNSVSNTIIDQFWNYFNLKQNRMKKIAFLTLVVSLTTVGLIATNTETNANEADTLIEGAWSVISSDIIKYGITSNNYNKGSNYSEMKIWSKSYYAYVGRGSRAGGYNYGGSGTYTLNGTSYTETIIYSADVSMVGLKVNLFLEVKNDTLTQIWPVDKSGNYDKNNYSIVKMVRLKEQPKAQSD